MTSFYGTAEKARKEIRTGKLGLGFDLMTVSREEFNNLSARISYIEERLDSMEKWNDRLEESVDFNRGSYIN